MRLPIVILLAAAALALAPADRALANPRPLPFSYPHATLASGSLEVEQYIDMSPVRVAREDDDGTRAVTSLRYDLLTELEYGITDRLEVGFYFAFAQAATSGAAALQFEGIKQRARLRLNDPGQWPINVGVYVETAQFHRELEFEEKLLLSRRFGRFDVVANLWVEQEWAFQDEEWKFLYNPTLGSSFDVSPNVQVGLEYWSRGRFDPDDGDETRHYLGPTALLQRGEYFLGVGAYARLDNLAESTVVGDDFGRLWVRAVVGVGL